MKIPIFPGKYHQNGGCSMAMLVYRRVDAKTRCLDSSSIRPKVDHPDSGPSTKVRLFAFAFSS